MNIIELFYSRRDSGSHKAFKMISNLVRRRKDIIFIAYDIDTTEGMNKALERRVREVPLIVINNQAVIHGTPFSEKQILDRMK